MLILYDNFFARFIYLYNTNTPTKDILFLSKKKTQFNYNILILSIMHIINKRIKVVKDESELSLLEICGFFFNLAILIKVLLKTLF